MWRALPIVAVMWLGCSKCSSEQPAPPKAVAGPSECTEAFAEIVPLSRCEEKCTAGDAEACAVASDLHRRGVRTRRDPKLGLERATRSCELGSSSGCSSLASAALSSAVEAADGGDADLTKFQEYEALAIKHAERECADGHARSCESLFFWYSRIERATKKENEKITPLAWRTIDLYRAGCDRGDWFMCRRLAMLYQVSGLGLARDVITSKQLYDKACKLGDAVSCKDAVPDDADDATSNPFLKRGCELGDSGACFLWSLRLTGPQATDVLARSCELGDIIGCKNLGRARKASGDLEGAKKALKLVCEMGEGTGCD